MKRKHLKFISVIIAAFMVLIFIAACMADNESGGGSSQTNNQTAGIDESDIVKVTDDGFIFKAQSDGLTVTKAKSGSMEIIVKERILGFTPNEMFVTNSLVVLVGSKTGAKSEVKIFNVDQLKNGETGYHIRSAEFDGKFFTARLFNNTVYLTTSISNININSYFYYDSVGGITEIPASETDEGQEIHTKGFIIAKFNLATISTTSTDAIAAKLYGGDHVSDLYMSPYAIYIISWLQERVDGEFDRGGCGRAPRNTIGNTKIIVVNINSLERKGEIPFNGNVLNRYSLYDNGKAFFLAGTLQSGTNVVNAYDTQLKKIGSSETFAPQERIFSVRYDGNICYVVTFMEWVGDPLFKIDISNPANIQIIGALDIEGYSTHLQLFSDNYLLGLGFDTWLFTATENIKLTLFGIVNDQPIEIESILWKNSFGYNSTSEATRNPKAILCEPDYNIFAFPAQYRDKTDNRWHQGVHVFGVVDGQLVELAFLTNYDTTVNSLNFFRNITRVARIENYLYTISDGFIASYSLADFSHIETLDTRIVKP